MGLTEAQMAERDESLKRLKITTYKDKKGYVFVSYKSDNWKKVFEEKVFQLQDMGLRVYSDKNFNDTNHPWLDDMDKNIKYSSAVVLFISCEYLKSYATLIELLTAIKHKKEIVPIYFARRDSLFDELEDDVDLEDDIIKMEPSEAKKLEALMQMTDGKYAESIKKIWNDCSDKFSAQKFSVMNVVDAFKTILCGNGFKDNLLGANNESLKNTINDACSNAKYSMVFESVEIDEEMSLLQANKVDDVVTVRTIAMSSDLKDLLLSDECSDINLKNLIKEDKIQIRISDSISFNESYLKYNTWLFSFDKKDEGDAYKWDFFILKKGELQADGKPECFDATNHEKSVFIQKSIRKAHLDGFKKISLNELLNGTWTLCFEEIKNDDIPSNVENIAKTEDTNTKKKSASVTGDITYTLYGKEYTDNQANMMLRVFAQVLKRHQDKVATLPEQTGMNCAMKYEDIKDPDEKSAYPSYFRSCQNFEFENGESVCIGTAYSSGDKMKKIARLLEICEEDRSVFYSDQIELPEAKVSKENDEKKATTNVGGMKYCVYGESLCGDQTDMMTTICSKIIERHPDKLQAVVDGTLCAGYNDADTMAKSYFRVYREFACNGINYVIGTSFGLPAKIKEIEKMIAICEEDVKNIEIDGVELNVKAPARKGRIKAKTNFLED